MVGTNAVEPSGSGELNEKTPAPVELPAEVRTKLRKLEKLESRYQGMTGVQKL